MEIESKNLCNHLTFYFDRKTQNGPAYEKHFFKNGARYVDSDGIHNKFLRNVYCTLYFYTLCIYLKVSYLFDVVTIL